MAVGGDRVSVVCARGAALTGNRMAGGFTNLLLGGAVPYERLLNRTEI
ncbi:MAG: hypothetical protein ACRDYX_15045 [Egibacteraceae bacterium]